MHVTGLISVDTEQNDLQPGLNLASQSAEVAYALKFVVGQLDREMTFQLGKQIECLQAINAEGLEEIFVGGEFLSGHLEVRRSQSKYLVKGVFSCWHNQPF